jgi:hypothetical protein
MPQRATASSRTPSADVRTIGAGKSGRFPVGRQAPDTVAHGTGDGANGAFVGADVVEITHAGSVVAALRLGPETSLLQPSSRREAHGNGYPGVVGRGTGTKNRRHIWDEIPGADGLYPI